MNQWTFFANLYTNLITPDIAQLQAMLGTVCATAQPIALALIALWMLLSFAELAAGTRRLEQIFKEFFVATMALTALQVGQYTPWISDMVLHGVPNTIGSALGGQTSPVAGLDNVLAQVLTAASKSYEALPSYSLKVIPLAGAIIVFMICSGVALCYAFGVYMVAAIINVVAVVVGPIFLALAAIPQTRRFASGWLGVVTGGIATQLMAIVVIQLLSGGEAIMINGFVVTAAASNSNAIAMLWGLAQVGMLLWLSKQVIVEIPAIARAIGGGVYHGTANLQSATFGAASSAAAAALGAARGAAGAVGAHAGRQVGGGAVAASTPVGSSLSMGRSL